MTFEEWVNARSAKQLHELASKKDDEYMLAVIRMAQEDMRERAANVCRVEIGYAEERDASPDAAAYLDIASSAIMQLPIEV